MASPSAVAADGVAMTHDATTTTQSPARTRCRSGSLRLSALRKLQTPPPAVVTPGVQMRIFCATIILLVTAGLALPSGIADVDPPSPGWAFIRNGLQLVDGECVGSVTVQYAFKSVDTPWAIGFEEDAGCSVRPDLRGAEHGDVLLSSRRGRWTCDLHRGDAGRPGLAWRRRDLAHLAVPDRGSLLLP